MAEALLMIDVQNDFVPGGALPVPDGDAVIEPLNRLAQRYDTVVATRDWHPPDHHSFEPEGGPWPVHCVQGTEGAELHPQLDRSQIDAVVDAGQEIGLEGYSAFEETDLEQMLRDREIDSLVVGGLATNICVRHTVLDARERGFAVKLVEDATRGIDIEEGDVSRSVEEMRAAGAQMVRSEDLL